MRRGNEKLHKKISDQYDHTVSDMSEDEEANQESTSAAKIEQSAPKQSKGKENKKITPTRRSGPLSKQRVKRQVECEQKESVAEAEPSPTIIAAIIHEPRFDPSKHNKESKKRTSDTKLNTSSDEEWTPGTASTPTSKSNDDSSEYQSTVEERESRAVEAENRSKRNTKIQN